MIRKITGLTQTRLADKLGVSFPAFNGWWTGKATPRAASRAAIDDLFLDVTGQKVIPDDVLRATKDAILRKASRHADIVGTISNNPDIRDQFILKLTYHSNRIEGSTLTESETADILFDNAVLPEKSLTEHLEVKNHQAALRYVFDHLGGGGIIDESLALKLHGIVVNGIMPDAGRYRRHPVRIVGVHLPTANYLKVPILIREVMREAGIARGDIISLCADIHARFEQVHPFSDGNGRVGRLLMNAMLMKANLPPAVIRQDDKRRYYAYLHKAQTTDDRTLLQHFLCDAIMDGLAILERRTTK